ncbi:MAG TPA: hypothetical protein VHD56_07800 [Tepidisphaeraceae bacterium]|nr:hypothetical protein [Tepidisphaeraceae bacterium]
MSNAWPVWKRVSHPIPLAICCLLIALFGILSYSAIRTKSATYDEPMHALAAWVHLQKHDFRMNFEDPPLWQYWAALPNGSDALKVDWESKHWTDMAQNTNEQWLFTADTLYRTPGNDGLQFLMRSRAMMVLVGMGLGVLIAVWTWQLLGPYAAVIATVLFALDPNLLGHAALVKNDVPMALMMLATFYVCWCIGRNLTWLNGVALTLVIAASVNIKFSALLFGPMLIVVFGIRILLPRPWKVLGRNLTGILQKSTAAVALMIAISLISYVSVWATYGFRFNPSSDPTVQFNTDLIKYQAVENIYTVAHPPKGLEPFDINVPLESVVQDLSQDIEAYHKSLNDLKAQLAAAKVSDHFRSDLQTGIDQWTKWEGEIITGRDEVRNFLNSPTGAQQAQDPAFRQQLVQTYVWIYNTRDRMHRWVHQMGIRSYWMTVGEDTPDGFIAVWNILNRLKVMPSAWLHGVLFVHARSILRGSYLMEQVKLSGWWYYFPLAMLFKTPIATSIALGVSLYFGIKLWRQRKSQWREFVWPLACLLVPFVIYMASVMLANLNIGLRHVLCVYPFMYIAAAVLLGRTVTYWKSKAARNLAILGLLLVVETLIAWPDYIAYFSMMFGGERGGLSLLGDSNLDWGQDLVNLAKWQREHDNAPLALAYFDENVNDPKFFGINYVPLPQGALDPTLASKYVLAISATKLQGVYGDRYEVYRQLTPTDVIGGTIYLYDLRPRQ